MNSIDVRQSDYRNDIDGLRAVAVLLIIVFHVNASWLPGGFVGVDMFFVISGYLITGIVSRELQSDQFSFGDFYHRRVQRILPALWVLLLLVLLISWRLMLPNDVEPLGKSALWSSLAMANVYFWKEVATDYFAPESAKMPLLHLWSLGVEEQFYLFWPAALAAIWAISKDSARSISILLALSVVFGATILAEVALAKQYIKFAYYMLPSRAGELAIGAALAIALPAGMARWHALQKLHSGLGLAGWLLLAISILILTESDPFPGWRSLLPTIGAGALIACGALERTSPFVGLLKLRPLVSIGRSSYSAYLWHWPLLAWWRYLWGQPDAMQGIGIILLTLLIARLSQQWVEDPLRRLKCTSAAITFWYVVAPALLIGLVGVLLARAERWEISVYPDATRKAWSEISEYSLPTHRVPWICQEHVLDAEVLIRSQCEWGANNGAKATIMLLGDSHAAHFAPLLKHAAEQQGVRVRSAAIGGCPPVTGSMTGLVPSGRVKACEDGMLKLLERAAEFPFLIIGGAWGIYDKTNPQIWSRFEETLRLLTLQGHKIWLLPRIPHLKNFDASCQAKQAWIGFWLHCPSAFEQEDPSESTNARLLMISTSIPGVRYQPFHKTLCQFDQCRATNSNGYYIYSDHSHLSLKGSLELANMLEQRGLLPRLDIW